MRVVKYVAGWPPERFPNGIVTATSVLAPAMRARGCDLRILAATGVSTDDRVSLLGDTAKVVDRLLIHRIQGRVRPQSAVFTLGAEQIARAISQTPGLRTADLLEIEESFGWTALLRKRLTMPIVVGLHGPWFLNGAALNDGIFDVQGRERVSREGCAIASAEAICARSRYVLNAVREYYALELREAATIPNPAQPAEQQSLWRRDKADPNEILFVGRFDLHKGADVLLRAFARLAAERPALRLTFAGPNDRPIPVNGRSYSAPEYLAKIMSPEQSARVTFLGFTPSNELLALRARAFVTVIASRIEIFPNVLLEAFTQGSPVVATEVGGIPEGARSGEDALLVEPENPDALAAAIACLLDNPEAAARLGESGRRRAQNEFSPERVADLTLEYYEEVLAKRAKAGAQTRARATWDR